MDEIYTISMNSNDKIHYRSLQANRKFDQSDPATIPYFEINIINAGKRSGKIIYKYAQYS